MYNLELEMVLQFDGRRFGEKLHKWQNFGNPGDEVYEDLICSVWKNKEHVLG